MWQVRMFSGEVEFSVASAGSGQAPTLLVVHGGPDWDHSYLREPLVRLAPARQLLLPDLRGCGRSARDLPLQAYHPDAAVADLLGVLDAFTVQVADVLGFSYGGLLAQRLAVAAPRRVRRLIIASSSVLPVPPDAYADQPLRERARAAERAIWADPTLAGPERTRAAAIAAAAYNLWQPTTDPPTSTGCAGSASPPSGTAPARPVCCRPRGSMILCGSCPNSRYRSCCCTVAMTWCSPPRLPNRPQYSFPVPRRPCSTTPAT